MSNARNIANLPNGDDAPLYSVRAYVVFDGTFNFPDTSTAVTSNPPIYKSANIESIIENNNSEYTVNFEHNMPNNRYVVVGSVVGSSSSHYYATIVADNAACEVDKFHFRCIHTQSGESRPQDPIQIAVIQ